jgi:hypothetical protein
MSLGGEKAREISQGHSVFFNNLIWKYKEDSWEICKFPPKWVSSWHFRGKEKAYKIKVIFFHGKLNSPFFSHFNFPQDIFKSKFSVKYFPTTNQKIIIQPNFIKFLIKEFQEDPRGPGRPNPLHDFLTMQTSFSFAEKN